MSLNAFNFEYQFAISWAHYDHLGFNLTEDSRIRWLINDEVLFIGSDRSDDYNESIAPTKRRIVEPNEKVEGDPEGVRKLATNAAPPDSEEVAENLN